MESRWSDSAAAAQPELEGLLYLSRLAGADPRLVLWGGGNTSAKREEADFRGRRVAVLRIKGSGSDLRTVRLEDFPGVHLEDVLPLQERDAMGDEEMVAYLAHTLLEPASPRPSIETLLHAFLPARIVVHTHADAILALTNTPSGRRWLAEALGPEAIWIEYRRPGFALAKQVAAAFRAAPQASCIVLAHHGLVTWGDTARQAYERTIDAVTRAERFVAARRQRQPRSAAPALDAAARRRVYWAVAPLLRGLAGRTTPEGEVLPPSQTLAVAPTGRMILRFDDAPDVLAFASDPAAARLSQIGPATPDHLIYTRRTALYVPLTTGPSPTPGRGEDRPLTPPPAGGPPVSPKQEEGRPHTAVGVQSEVLAAELLAGLERALAPAWQAWVTEYRRYVSAGSPNTPAAAEVDVRPRVVLLPGVGMVTLGRDARAAQVSADIYHHAIATIRDAEAVEAYTSLGERDCYDVEYWPLERYRLTLAPPEQELARKVALVTGAASGIGKAIAARLCQDGAHVVIADLDGAGARTLADELNARYGAGRATGVPADVADEASVESLLDATVEAFGGLDVLVSNAGIAPFSALDQTSLADWQRSLDVNATGHFLVLRAAARVLKRQGLGGNVIFISTKNTMAPGKEFGAYSAAKSAQAQLARVAAMELGEFGIRVNMINPDAVFRGSGLWSPELRRARAAAHGGREDQLGDFYRQRCLLGVPIYPEDVAEAAWWLASERSRKTSGGVITVDGGVPAAFPR